MPGSRNFWATPRNSVPNFSDGLIIVKRRAFFVVKTGTLDRQKDGRKSNLTRFLLAMWSERAPLMKMPGRNHLLLFTYYAAHKVLDWNVPTITINSQSLLEVGQSQRAQ